MLTQGMTYSTAQWPRTSKMASWDNGFLQSFLANHVWSALRNVNSLWFSGPIWCHRSWRHQAITCTNVDLLSVWSCGICMRAVSQEVLSIFRAANGFANGTFNSLDPGRFVKKKITYVIFKLILVTDGWGIYCEIALRWISMNPTDDKSTLVQVMAWCHQATSHYLSQCWPRSMSPYGVTRPQCKLIGLWEMWMQF